MEKFLATKCKNGGFYMKLGKKEIESIAILLLLVSMLTTSTMNSVNTGNKISSIPTQRTTAGVNSAMEIDKNLFEHASIDDTNVIQVTSALEDGAEEVVTGVDQEMNKLLDEKTEAFVPSPWAIRVIANIEGTLNVRDTPVETGNIVGKMSKGNVATIIENTGTWYKIQSGNVTGYVLGAYCLTGPQAQEYANATGITYAISLSDGLRVRTGPDAAAAIATTVNINTQLKVDTAAAAVENWTAVLYNGKTAYVATDYVSIQEILSTALTIEEYNAILKAAEDAKKAAAAEKAARVAKAAAQSAQAATMASVNKGAVSVSVDDETLLAAIIYCEAGNQSYEGKLAVGSVVMNRIRSGRFPNSISAVIYQGGQFTPAYTGVLARALAREISSSCRQAAQEALAGADNVGGALFFNRVSSGKSGLVIGGHVFY